MPQRPAPCIAAGLIVALWLIVLAVAGLAVGRARISADLTAFLPAAADPLEQLLIEQLRDGVVARTILISIEGGAAPQRAAASRALTGALAADPRFRFVANGSLERAQPDRDRLFGYRYLLSPALGPDHFSAGRLRESLRTDLALLGGAGGALVARTVGADPTGESLAVLSRLAPRQGPQIRQGVWFSADGLRAVAFAETRAAGFDTDAQAAALAAIRQAFADLPEAHGLVLALAGPGVFAAQARASIEQDATRLSAIATACVVLILLWVYRSPGPLLVAALPVASGLVAGIAAVSAHFGLVHGITLGFGATLIGEAVDYPSYLLIQREPGEPLGAAAARIGQTLRLAVLTTVFSSLTLLLSSFGGLQQLGLLSLIGILAAGLVTRRVLPALLQLLPAWSARWAFAGGAGRAAMPGWLDPARWPLAGRRVRAAAGLLILAAAVHVLTHADALWDDDLENLSPVSASAKALDGALRSDLHAPDVRTLLVVRAGTEQAVLEASESIRGRLAALAQEGAIGGFELPSDVLPSLREQARRRASLPDRQALAAALAEASRGLPFRPGAFSAFLADVEAAREGPLVRAADLQDTALGVKLRATLLPLGTGWCGLIALQEVRQPAALRSLAGTAGAARLDVLDLKAQSNALVLGYRAQSLRLTGLGLCAIAAVLVLGLGSLRRTMRILAPVLGAAVLCVALLQIAGVRLSLFHLVALLLVVGVGVNYALFFERPEPDAQRRSRTALSLCVCGMTTLSAFGALAASALPVLHALGLTVSLGIVLAFALAAVLSRPARDGRAAAGRRQAY
jgi:predicted exporter